MPEKKLALTINEASEYTGIGRNNLRNIVRSDKLPVIRVGRKILIRTEVLESFLCLNQGNDLADVSDIIAIENMRSL